jgi:hypothetical protein
MVGGDEEIYIDKDGNSPIAEQDVGNRFGAMHIGFGVGWNAAELYTFGTNELPASNNKLNEIGNYLSEKWNGINYWQNLSS